MRMIYSQKKRNGSVNLASGYSTQPLPGGHNAMK